MKYIKFLGILFFLVVTTASAADLMSKIGPGVEIEPSKDKALVIFLRPSSFGGFIQSSIFDISGEQDELIGIVPSKTKVAYHVAPGKKLFMVIAENADFLNATLDAGKTYYVLVSPRPGLWKARFSLLPIHNDPLAKRQVDSEEFADWMKSTRFVEKNAASDAWYEKAKKSIDQKKAEYLEKWDVMLPEDKAVLTLNAEDGI